MTPQGWLGGSGSTPEAGCATASAGTSFTWLSVVLSLPLGVVSVLAHEMWLDELQRG